MYSPDGQRYGGSISRPRAAYEAVTSMPYGMNLGSAGINPHNRSASYIQSNNSLVSGRTPVHQHSSQQIRSPNQFQSPQWNSSGGYGSVDPAAYLQSHNHRPLHTVPRSSSQQRQSHGGRPSQNAAFPEYRFSNGPNSVPRDIHDATDWANSLTWPLTQEASMPSDSRMWNDLSSFWPGVDAVQLSASASPEPSLLQYDAVYRVSSPSTSSSAQSSAQHSPKMRQSSRPMSPLTIVEPPQSHSRQDFPTSGTGSEGVKMCTHCKATSTPLWRRDPQTLKQLCNACGLYLQQRHKLRPQELIDADAEDDEEEDLPPDWTGNECTHCHTRNTSVWRRSKDGEQLCNACGVYKRLRGKDRPLELKRNRIKPRSKHSPK